MSRNYEIQAEVTHQTLPPEVFLPDIFQTEIDRLEAFNQCVSRVFRPRLDESEVLSTPINWECSTRSTDRNWRMQLQGLAFFQPVIPFFDQYSASQQEQIFRFVYDSIVDWMLVYGGDPEDIVTSRMPDSYAWYDMSVGYRALAVAFFCSRGIERFCVEEGLDIKALNEFVLKHIRHLSTPAVLYRNNHGLFQMHGLSALVRCAVEGAKEVQSSSYAGRMVEELILSQFSDEGIHLEHSPHYHFYILQVVTNILESGWYSSDLLRKRLEQAARQSKWLIDPLGRVVTVGDSLLVKPQVGADLLNVPNVGKHFVSSTIEKSGYSIVRSGWGCAAEASAFLFMTGAHHSNVHKHRDCLSFEWHVGGVRLLCDSGKYGYHTDEFRRYALSNRAHNVIEIDGFDVLEMTPRGSMLLPSYINNGLAFLSGVRRYKAFQHTREIVSYPRKWLVIFDEIEQVKYKPVTQWLHLGETFITSKNEETRYIFEGENSMRLAVETLGSDSEIEIFHADEETMNGFLFTLDDVVSPGIAISRTVVDNSPVTRLATVVSLDEDAHFEAVAFAESYRS